MVKSYLKYEHTNTFGLIASPTSNVIWASKSTATEPTQRSSDVGIAIVGANEEVICWDLRKSELIGRWRDATNIAEVTVITPNPIEQDVYAVGYGDGTIRLWDRRLANVIVLFNGHKSAITKLVFDTSGTQLASGAKDTDIIVWDLVNEVGLFKLRGHKDGITGLCFLSPKEEPSDPTSESNHGSGPTVSGIYRDANEQDTYLVSTSKDASLKVWDLEGQHCIETHSTQNSGQCWASAVSADQSVLLTGGNDGLIGVWSLDVSRLSILGNRTTSGINGRCLNQLGTLSRQTTDHSVGLDFDSSGRFVAAHGSKHNLVEIWRIRSEGEIRKKLARKRKRRRDKQSTISDKHLNGDVESLDPDADISSAVIEDIVSPHADVRTDGIMSSICWANAHSSKSLQLLTAQKNNKLELWCAPRRSNDKSSGTDRALDIDRSCVVDLPGHRADIRTLALSSDDRMLASAGQGGFKIWNLRTSSCIRTLPCGYAYCATFLPGDKILVIGNSQGELELFDISSSSAIETIKAHDNRLWSMQVHPDGRSMVTASEDKSAKFFRFEVTQQEIPGTKRTTPRFHLIHSRTLQVNDAVLSVRLSPDAKLIALSLMDNTVKVFFVDTLKLFWNLYGHKLPVLSMDISYDSKLVVTCSADKNVRLWGLDHGDCRKAIFAHQDNITQVAFVPSNQDGNGHHFFSVSKDRLLKYWDGDKFEHIQKLEGHHGEIHAMAVSRNGDVVITAGHDKSIRVWNQTDEQIFLEEEREKELEELYESTLSASLDKDADTADEDNEAVSAGKQTKETLMAGEKIAEALEVGLEDMKMMAEYSGAKAKQQSVALPSRNPIFLAFKNIAAEAHLLNVVQRIKAAALQDALLVLTFDKVCDFFIFLRIWAERRWNMPLTCRILFFLLKTHHKQIVASKRTRVLLDGIKADLRYSLETQKDEIGFNLAALRYVGRTIGETSKRDFIDSMPDDDVDLSQNAKKRGFIDIA